jgi:serine/threonine-protein kinase
VEGRTDQYALACVLFECLTASGPFEGETEAMVMYGHVSGVPPSLTGRRPDVTGRVDGVLARALAKRPEERYPRCVEFLEDFRAASSSAHRTVLAPPPVPPVAPPPPPLSRPHPRWSPPGRDRPGRRAPSG